MFFKTFTSTCFAIALSSSAVSASSAVKQEDAMPTATEEFLSQTMTEGESGGIFWRSKEPVWDYFEDKVNYRTSLVQRKPKYKDAKDPEKMKLIAKWGGEETTAYKEGRIGYDGREYSEDDIIAHVDQAAQKWASDKMQNLARTIKYLIKDTDCAEAAEATTKEQKMRFYAKFYAKLFTEPNHLLLLFHPFEQIPSDYDYSKTFSFDTVKDSIKAVAAWNDSAFQFEGEASLKHMRSSLLSDKTSLFLSDAARSRVARKFDNVDIEWEGVLYWWAGAIFLTMFESVCQAEYEAWGSPDVNFFVNRPKK